MKRRWKFFSLPGAGALLFGVGLSLGLPSAAQAQYPCGNGPGPGEVVVGQTGGGPGHAPILLCQYVGGGEGSDGESKSTSQTATINSTPIQPSYMAAVTHIDTSAYWVSRAHWTADSAKKRALAACTAAMGDGCVVTETVYGYGPFGVMIDAMGLPWIKSGGDFPNGTPEEVRYQALARLCHTNSFGCEFQEVIYQGALPTYAVPPDNFVSDIFPPSGVKRHHWALVARPKGTPAAAGQNKVWLTSGSQNSAAARKAVLDRCRTDSGGDCAIDAYVANGVLVQFRGTDGQTRWASAVTKRAVESFGRLKKEKAPKIDPTSVAGRVERLCPLSAQPCKVIATYDAVTPRMQVIENSK